MRSMALLELHVRRHPAIDASHWPARGTKKAPTDASPDRHAAVTMADSIISGPDAAVQSKRLILLYNMQHGTDQTCLFWEAPSIKRPSMSYKTSTNVSEI